MTELPEERVDNAYMHIEEENTEQDDSNPEQRMLEVAHAAVEAKAGLIGMGVANGGMADPGYKWHTTVHKYGRSYEVPMSRPAARNKAAELGFEELRTEFKQPGARGGKTGTLSHMNDLLKHFDKGICTVPRFRHVKTAEGKLVVPAGVQRLQKANTAEKMDRLLYEREREAATATVEGTQTNTESKFSNFKHFATESGKASIRWQAADGEKEWPFFKRFLTWGSVRWDSYTYLDMAWSDVKSVHRRLADVIIPEYPGEKKYMADLKLLMSRTTAVRKARDLLTNCEMNTYQDEARETVTDYVRARAASHTTQAAKERAITEANFDFVTTLQRKHGLRPGETAKKHADFVKALKAQDEIHADERVGEQQQTPWNKAHVIALGSVDLGKAGWLTPMTQKASASRGNSYEAELLEIPLPFVNVIGRAGLYTAVQAAQRLMAADPLQEGEDPTRIPCVRDPRTGKSWSSGQYSACLQAHFKNTMKEGDTRVITGYSVKHSSNFDFKQAAANSHCKNADELQSRFLSHAGGGAAPRGAGVTARYNRECQMEVLKMAQLAHFTTSIPAPRRFAGPESMEQTELPALSKQEQAFCDGWEPTSLAEVLESVEMADSQKESDEMVALYEEALDEENFLDLDAQMREVQRLRTEARDRVLECSTGAPPVAPPVLGDAATLTAAAVTRAAPTAEKRSAPSARPAGKVGAQRKKVRAQQKAAAPAVDTGSTMASEGEQCLVYPAPNGKWGRCERTDRGNGGDYTAKLLGVGVQLQNGVRAALQPSAVGDGARLWTEITIEDGSVRKMPRSTVFTALVTQVGAELPASIGAPLVFADTDRVWKEGFPVAMEKRGPRNQKVVYISMLKATGEIVTVPASRVQPITNERGQGQKCEDPMFSPAAASTTWGNLGLAWGRTRSSPRNKDDSPSVAEAGTVRVLPMTTAGKDAQSAIPRSPVSTVPQAGKESADEAMAKAAPATGDDEEVLDKIMEIKRSLNETARAFKPLLAGQQKAVSKLKKPKPARLNLVLRRYGLTVLGPALEGSAFDTDIRIRDGNVYDVSAVIAEAELPWQFAEDALELACVLKRACSIETDVLMDADEGPTMIGQTGAIHGVWALQTGPLPSSVSWGLQAVMKKWKFDVLNGHLSPPLLGVVANMEQAVSTIKQVADFIECGLRVHDIHGSFMVGKQLGVPAVVFLMLTALASKDISLDGVIWWHDETEMLIDDPVTLAALERLQDMLMRWRVCHALTDPFWEESNRGQQCIAFFMQNELQHKKTGFTLQWIVQVLLATFCKGWHDAQMQESYRTLYALTGVKVIMSDVLKRCPWQWTPTLAAGIGSFNAAGAGQDAWSMAALTNVWIERAFDDRDEANPGGTWRELQLSSPSGKAAQYEPTEEWPVAWEEEDGLGDSDEPDEPRGPQSDDDDQAEAAAANVAAAEPAEGDELPYDQVVVCEDNVEEWRIFMGYDLEKPAQQPDPVPDSPPCSSYGGASGWGHSTGGEMDDRNAALSGAKGWGHDERSVRGQWGPPSRSKAEIAAGHARVIAHRQKMKEEAAGQEQSLLLASGQPDVTL